VSRPSTWTSYRVALIPYLATGDATAMNAFQASLSPDALRNDPISISMRALWYYTVGDAASLVQLWKDSGKNWAFEPFDHEDDRIAVAEALTVSGMKDEAKAVLVQQRDETIAALKNQPDDMGRLEQLLRTQVLLGDTSSARETRSRALAKDPSVADRLAIDFLWTGESADKDAAIETLRKYCRLKLSDVWFSNVHLKSHGLDTWPVHDDPKFQAMISDPANNAPAF
jgi:tetratricopeptide (TPR) repeat protein